MAAGGLLAFCALALERVSIVNTLVQTQPFFVFLISYFYLKEVEHVSKNGNLHSNNSCWSDAY
jgi:drug/metabolite transporter (DMT)-like permease